jgi:hypothetical protein
MTIWLALFVLIIIASFILAYLSMKDYQETPAKSALFGIFLIQNPHHLNNAILNSQFHEISKIRSVVTLERLFKGSKSALVMTGPKDVLRKYSEILNLLELEDYTNIDESAAAAWEVGVKEDVPRPLLIDDLFKDFVQLRTDEQFWWQLTLQTSPIKKHSILDFLGWLILAKKSNTLTFHCQIRAVLYAPDPSRRQQLSERLENSLGDGKLIKIPRPVTSNQIFGNYKLRSITPADPHLLSLVAEEVLSLVGKSN